VGLGTQADSDPWSVELKVVYPNGETLSTLVPYIQQMSPASPATGTLAGGASGVVSNKARKTLSNDETTLVFNVGSVAADTTVTIQPLADENVPALDVGMTNVTKGPRRGYRYLPHGSKFLQPVSLAMPYDKALIPPGHTRTTSRPSTSTTRRAAGWSSIGCRWTRPTSRSIRPPTTSPT